MGGALTAAIKEFGGGVIIISHNREFADSVATEKWIMDKGNLRREGEVVGDDVALDKSAQGPDEVFDASGNTIDVKQQKTLSEKDKKKKIKDIEKKRMYELMDELEKLKGELAV